MAEIKEFKAAEKHLLIQCGDSEFIISVSDVRRLSIGDMSIAEMDDPEKTAQAIAIIAMESINANS